MIYLFTKYLFYFSCFVIAILVLKLLWEIGNRQKIKYLKSIKIVFSLSSILIFCWYLFLSFALIVRPPFQATNNLTGSHDLLSEWIIGKEIKYGFSGIAVIFLVGILTYFYQVKIEKETSIKEPLLLGLINFFILSLTLFITYIHTYSGLSQEAGYYFK